VLLLAPAAYAQDLPESSPQALMHHAQGIDAYVRGSYDDAIKHFRLAIASDPTSYASMFMAGVAAGNAGNGALADSFFVVVQPHNDQLSPYYRYRLEAAMAGRAGNLAAMIAANKKAAALGEGTKAWYNVAQAGVPPAEARSALRKLDPDREPMKGWYGYYTVYESAAHRLGDYEDALKMAQRARVAMSDDPRSLSDEAEQLAALGRVAEAESRLAEVARAGNRMGLNVIGTHTAVGLELMAHGNVNAGRRAIEAGLKYYDALPPDSQKTVDNRGNRAYALYSLGRFKELPLLYSGLAADAPNTAAWKAWVGYAAALNGDRAKATEIAQKIQANEIKLGVTGLMYRGLIAGGLGDREQGLALFREYQVKPIWMHRDPNVSKIYGPQWVAFLKE
jgi:tetratricopeptide (TPR) repeat protein